MRPLPRRDGGTRRSPDACRLAANEGVFAVRLVPHWRNDHAVRGKPLESGELGLGLVCKSVTDAKRESWQCEHAERIPTEMRR
jgi:hypothetical protein